MKATKSIASAGAPRKLVDQLARRLLGLVSRVSSSEERASTTPSDRARSLILEASAKAATVSGTLALPPGPSIPVVGALGIGGYAFYDTIQVGKTTLAFFEKQIVREDAPGDSRPRSTEGHDE